MIEVIWVPSAIDDLRKIQEYIARDSMNYARKFTEDAFNSTERLTIFPKSGRVVPEYGNPNIREIGHGSYRIIYELVNGEVHVLAVIHGRRLIGWSSSGLRK